MNNGKEAAIQWGENWAVPENREMDLIKKQVCEVQYKGIQLGMRRLI